MQEVLIRKAERIKHRAKVPPGHNMVKRKPK